MLQVYGSPMFDAVLAGMGSRLQELIANGDPSLAGTSGSGDIIGATEELMDDSQLLVAVQRQHRIETLRGLVDAVPAMGQLLLDLEIAF